MKIIGIHWIEQADLKTGRNQAEGIAEQIDHILRESIGTLGREPEKERSNATRRKTARGRRREVKEGMKEVNPGKPVTLRVRLSGKDAADMFYLIVSTLRWENRLRRREGNAPVVYEVETAEEPAAEATAAGERQ